MSDNNLLERARALAGSTAFVALPLAAVAPAANAVTLLTDYSVVGEYSNSGWFMSWLDDAAADATPLGNGFKLTGSKTITDSLFWRWDDNVQATVRRYDVTGMAFAWGGAIDGALRPGDTLSAPFDLILDYTHTLPQFAAYDYFGVNWHLTVGLRADGDSPYTPDFYRTLPTSNSVSYVDAYGSVDQPGQFGFSGNLNISIDDWASQATHWYAVLTVDWNDALAQRGYEDTHGSHNGDTLTFTVPGDSIDLTIAQGKTTFAGETIENNGGYTVPSWSILRTAGTFRNLSSATLRIEGTAETTEGGVVQNLLGGLVQNAGTFRNLLGGLFGNAGTFDNEAGGTVENSGTIKNMLGGLFGGAGQVTNNSDGVIENAGMMRGLLGGSFDNYGKVDNLAGATIENEGSMQNMFGGLFGNAGTILNKSGADFSNAGTFTNALGGLFGNAGTLTNQYSGLFGNIGTLNNALGGQLFNYGQFTNSSNHTVNNDGYFFTDGMLENTSTGVFNNNGTVEIGYSGSLINDGEFNNEGAIANSGYVYVGAAGTIGGSGTYEQWYGYTMVDGTLSASQIALHGGYLAGSGVLTATASLTIDEGVSIMPGGEDAAGQLTIEGDFAPDANSGLLIDIKGAQQGTEYDLLAIAGEASLAGNLYLYMGYEPVAGTVFTILTATGGVHGQFANIFAGGLQVAPIYGTDSVSIQFGAPVPEPGTYAMFLAGLGLLGLWSKRRR